MAATEHQRQRFDGAMSLLRNAAARLRRALASLGPVAPWLGVMAGALGGSAVRAADLPADQAEALLHTYKGGGITANGPALLVRKRLADKVSLTGSYYVDMVSNASIDVVTTASPFKEKRTAYDIAMDYVVRDTSIRVSRATSREPDYQANAMSVDLTQEVFGNMTSVNLGFTRGWDNVGKVNEGFFDRARHWQYRMGVSQVLNPRWVAALQFEAIANDGYLGNPYRVARVFGAAVPERTPRTRSSRALTMRTTGSLAQGEAVRAEYRYFWDTWAIKAHTVELGYTRGFGSRWSGDAFVRLHQQSDALFYSDNATAETQYLTRNRQLSAFVSPSAGVKANYAIKHDRLGDLRVTGSVELKQFSYSNFTDVRTGKKYSHKAALLQFGVTSNF